MNTERFVATQGKTQPERANSEGRGRRHAHRPAVAMISSATDVRLWLRDRPARASRRAGGSCRHPGRLRPPARDDHLPRLHPWPARPCRRRWATGAAAHAWGAVARRRGPLHALWPLINQSPLGGGGVLRHLMADRPSPDRPPARLRRPSAKTASTPSPRAGRPRRAWAACWRS